jgi:hypothetical protein
MAWRVLHWCRDAEEVEAFACLEGLRASSRWPDRMVLLESDCSTVIGKFQERCRDRSIISPVICDGLEAIKALSDVSFSRVSRELNRVAHELAHLAIRSKESRVSLVDIPDCIKSLVYSERPE